MKKYQIIYADPPWKYKDAAKHKAGAILHYPTLSLNDLMSLPINNIAANDCVLFMWVTMPLLQEGLDLGKAWGFKYKTCGFTWVKYFKCGKLFFGLGHWTRANAELCLLFTKGKPKRISASVSQIVCEQIRKHSQKPDVVKNKIKELLGDDIQAIELFARNKTEGWDVWGNEIDNDIDLTA